MGREETEEREEKEEREEMEEKEDSMQNISEVFIPGVTPTFIPCPNDLKVLF